MDLTPEQFELLDLIKNIEPQMSEFYVPEPLQSEITVNSFPHFIERLNFDSTAKYDNRDLIKNHFKTSLYTNILIEKIINPDVKVAHYSRFLKRLYVTLINSDVFLESIAKILDDKINNINLKKYNNIDVAKIERYGVLTSELYRRGVISEEIFRKYVKKSIDMIKTSYDDFEIQVFCLIFEQCSMKLKLKNKELYDFYINQATEFYNSKLVSERFKHNIKIIFEIEDKREAEEIESEKEEDVAGGYSDEPGSSSPPSTIPKR
jgi:hypothetical protein